MLVRMIKVQRPWGRSAFWEEPIYYIQVKRMFWWSTIKWARQGFFAKNDLTPTKWLYDFVELTKVQIEKDKRKAKLPLFGTREVITVVSIPE